MAPETAALLGALIAACVGIGTTFLTNRHAINMQSSADAIQREERARAFQRENLLACQDTMQVIERLTAKAFHEEAMAWGKGTPWGTHYLLTSLDDDLAANKRKFAVLVERVADDALRNKLKLVSVALTQVVMAGSFEDARTKIDAAMTANAETAKQLGVVLRKTY